MILVIGGHAAGKLNYIRSLGYGEEQIARSLLDERPALHGLEELLRQDPTCGEEIMPRLLQKEIIACDEVGLGIVPLDKRERQYREAVGQLCICLAQEAEQVIRLICGIPQRIK